MRAYLLVLFLLVSPVVFAQQTNHLPVVQQKMQALKWVTGKWQGPCILTAGDGTKHEFKQTETLAPRLHNSVILLNEAASLGQDTIFQNIGMLGYDALKSKYTLKAYTKEGTQVDGDVEVQDKKMIWRLQIPGAMVRYTIRLNEKGQWHQIGEGSEDKGNNWRQFFEATLSRVN